MSKNGPDENWGAPCTIGVEKNQMKYEKAD